jgi:starch-binding outer membrane protein, SusD/RagB family
MQKLITLATIGGLALLAAGCTDNPTAPGVDRVVAGSQQTLQSLATGVLASDRGAAAGQGYLAFGDIMARDVVRPDPNEPRWTSEFFEQQPDPSDFIGGAQWTAYYQVIRAIKTLINDPTVTSLSANDQAAARGFLRTLEAQEYIRLIEYRDANGIVIQGDDPTTVDPIVGKITALNYIAALLDTAQADLAAADGATVPFTLPSSFTDAATGDYSNSANVLLYNRGLAGKVQVYLALPDSAGMTSPVTANATAAVADLNIALAGGTPTQAYLNKGPYYQFNPNSPESFSNPLVDAHLLVTTNFVNSLQPGDARGDQIISVTPQAKTGKNGAQYGSAFQMAYSDPGNTSNLTREIPILRNAELYLLRAQAEIALGQLGPATDDINVVHTVEGGLAPYPTFTTAAAAIQAVLYEYRYSFILQGPQHLIALREYGLLNPSYLQPGMPTPGAADDAFVHALPITQNEKNARNGNVTPVGP